MQSDESKKKRVAICLKGAMSKKTGNLHTKHRFDEYRQNKNYCDYKSVHNCFLEHIIKPNRANYDIDVFLHSWNPDLENQLKNLYKPVSSLLEDNNLYSEDLEKKLKEVYPDETGLSSDKYAFASSSLSVKKSLQLKDDYEHENNFKYDIVLIYRPDVILLKDINFDKYDVHGNVIYCNHTWINPHIPMSAQGEYYWIMSSETSKAFKSIYEAKYEAKFICHQGIYYFMRDVLHAEHRNDDVMHGVDITAARTEMITGIGSANLKKYGFNF
jgi:hypothetical protein